LRARFVEKNRRRNNVKREDWTVGEEGVRPAGKPDECFYCHSKVGDQHAAECVIRKRTVVVEMTIKYVIDVPEAWDESNIEFHRNESSWCANNARQELLELFDYVDKAGGSCLCDRVQYKYVREATENDEKDCGVLVTLLSS
jgi:hypothetical protein